MTATQVRLADLTDWDACYDVREGIMAEPRNFVGGISAWASGYEIVLTSAAQRKLDAIERKMQKLAESGEEF